MPAVDDALRAVAELHPRKLPTLDTLDAVQVLAAEVQRLRNAWVPAETRWRHTLPGDAFTGAGSTLWRITASGAHGEQWRLDVARAGEPPATHVGDPDDTVPVLVPVLERDAFVLLREQLGAQLIEREAS